MKYSDITKRAGFLIGRALFVLFAAFYTTSLVWAQPEIQADPESDLPSVADSVTKKDADSMPMNTREETEPLQVALLPSLAATPVAKNPASSVLPKRHHSVKVPRSVPAPKAELDAFHVLKKYIHPNGFCRLRYPGGWQVKTKKNAVLIQAFGENEEHGIFGIIRRRDNHSNDQAIAQEFKSPNRANDLTQTSTDVAGMPAIQIEGSSKDNPDIHMVEYYIQCPLGDQYRVVMLAPSSQWPRFGADFKAMLASLSFR